MTVLRIAALPVLLCAVALAAGCGTRLSTGDGRAQDSQGARTPEIQPSFTQFPDIPVPSRADMEVDRTLVFGGDSGWYGRLVLTSGHPPAAMFDFYKQEMSGFGWQPITMVRATVSVLTYVRDGRVATIQIGDGTLRGSEISITVAPRQSSGGVTSAPVTPAVR